MSEHFKLRELYQEVIIDHGRNPRNFGSMPAAQFKKEGYNPLCGDKIIIYVKVKDGLIDKIQFEGSGCAISMASASLLSEILKGKSLAEYETIFADFHRLVTEGRSSGDLGKLAVMGGVSEFPARVKCATLSWHTLKAALQNDFTEISTE